VVFIVQNRKTEFFKNAHLDVINNICHCSVDITLVIFLFLFYFCGVVSVRCASVFVVVFCPKLLHFTEANT